MRGGQQFAEVAGDGRHAIERKDEARQQYGGQNQEYRHLHGLELGPRRRRNDETQREVRGDEDGCGEVQVDDAAATGTWNSRSPTISISAIWIMPMTI